MNTHKAVVIHTHTLPIRDMEMLAPKKNLHAYTLSLLKMNTALVYHQKTQSPILLLYIKNTKKNSF